MGEAMRAREIIRALAAGYTPRLNDRGMIEAKPPEVEIEEIPTNPEEPNPLTAQDQHRYR